MYKPEKKLRNRLNNLNRPFSKNYNNEYKDDNV